jgi:gas vesicle protein
MNRNNGKQALGFLSGFLVGGLVGAAVALITAPQSGEETRQQIRAKGIELRADAQETVDEALLRIKATAADLSAWVEDFQGRSQAVLNEGRQQIAEATQEARKAAERAVDETKRAALEAVEEIRKSTAAAVEETKKAAVE